MSAQPRSAIDFQQITDHVLSLPIDQKVELVQRLNDSLDESPPTPEHQERVMAIVRRRAEELRKGTANEVSHAEVTAYLDRPARCD